ncbi:GNAT family N-acetyltransferase [Leptospira yasudae]|uniref:GNAT family N-acetyltransferase n=1 Tax=Leptospira yasudae TaxID=2202201 RepID=UPI001C4F1868|nr:GNAT family protein [Leptospira yasudae]MBW0434112.1 GNAT family N-acetyltransferase [Leptospira yasudae]
MIYSFLENYYVRPLNQTDLSGPYPTWFEDQDITKYNSHGKFFKNRSYFEDYYNSLNHEGRVVWAICHDKDGHLGNISLQNISFIDRNAEFAIILGNKDHQGKRVSYHAGSLLLFHGFEKLNLTKIYCGTAESNVAMQKLALSLGMREEGRRRKHLFLNGSYEDMIEYGILLDDWRKLQK